MQPSVVQRSLDRILEQLAADRSGEVADYIPELAKGDPDRFGIAVATVDGHVYATGDTDDLFTIQSISKPFVYGMALDDRGADDVLRHVGVEPSGDAFNSIVMDEANNRPLNPMVNAGAIACASLVRGESLGARRRRVLSTFGRYAGRELAIDEAVCESERRTGHRNRAIAYLELNSGMIEEPVEEHLDVYFSQCSILVNARDLAVMAATLANGGRNPLTGLGVLAPPDVTRVLTVMATCGMYDWSGEWMYRIGLPAKSGVGGGIIAVLPGQLGIGVFSPRLDPHGNSVRGVRACEELGDLFRLHLLDTTSTAVPVVRHRYDGTQIHSKRLRRPEDRELLDDLCQGIVVLQLQGDLYFGSAEKLVRTVEELAGVTHLVLDAQRIGRSTTSALTLLAELRRELEQAGSRVLLAACPEPLRAALLDPAVGWPAADLWPDTDHALERCEDEILFAVNGHPHVPEAAVELGQVEVLRRLTPEQLAVLEPLLVTERYDTGDVVLHQGDPADRLCFLLSGSATSHVSSSVDDADPRRLRTFGPGTVFGEGALLDGGHRTTSVTADGPLVIRTLPAVELRRLATEQPAVHAALLAGVGPYLSELLTRALAEIQALDS